MKTPVQQQHDQSLTALLTLRDNPGLAPRIRRLVQKQITGRAWKYASRENGANFCRRYSGCSLRHGFRASRLATRRSSRPSTRSRHRRDPAHGNRRREIAAAASGGATPVHRSAAKNGR